MFKLTVYLKLTGVAKPLVAYERPMETRFSEYEGLLVSNPNPLSDYDKHCHDPYTDVGNGAFRYVATSSCLS